MVSFWNDVSGVGKVSTETKVKTKNLSKTKHTDGVKESRKNNYFVDPSQTDVSWKPKTQTNSD